jgi:hypothetical protein
MYSGERRSYLIALLWVLLTVESCKIDNVLYDIGPCQFQPTLGAFLRLPPSDDLGLPAAVIAHLVRCLFGANFPLLPFHFYCHRALCQALFDAYQMKNTALQHGEGTEMKWSLFGRVVGRLKGMAKAARYTAIEYWWSTENRRQDVRNSPPQPRASAPCPCEVMMTRQALFAVADTGSPCCWSVFFLQEALGPLLVTWLAKTVKRKKQWAAQLDTVRAVIEEKNLTVDACLLAAATARVFFFEKCRQPAAALSPQQTYDAAIVKSVIAVST